MQQGKGSSCLLIVVAILLLGSFVTFPLMFGQKKEEVADLDCSPQSPITEVKVENLPLIKGYSEKQITNAAIIINEAKVAQVERQGAIIGLMTALQESTLTRLANDGKWKYPEGSRVMTKAQWKEARKVVLKSMDLPHEGVGSAWDALGLFQQRPSAGWGSVEQILKPEYGAKKFFEALKKVDNWENIPYHLAAEKVQISGKPDNYADRRPAAEAIYNNLQNSDYQVTESLGNGDEDSTNDECKKESEQIKNDKGPVEGGWVTPVEYSKVWYNYGEPRGVYPHAGEDFAAPAGTPIWAAAAGTVIRTSCDFWNGRSPCNVLIDHGRDGTGRSISTLYVHMYPKGVHVKAGDVVKAGDHIADVGTNGNSTGYHLHFEVWIDGQPTSPVGWLKKHGSKF
ncbi:hypothetical protein CIK76_18925 [Glutamicibacter sp. BW80]|uniref:M23 family metallopeptidase n=1 Tax=Glutamicibacter sp. BW80 TaxID=2024404 RepID=UPI000BB76A9F|nr:M23 family metallopeptidase [Glutamicibacter sp. BW80]PCC27066.1 hypothetical protein CIK76_18925 [Glutamicibacter sp. BW80]